VRLTAMNASWQCTHQRDALVAIRPCFNSFVERVQDPEKSTYAFYSGSPSGSGVENWFQEYEGSNQRTSY
jgi:hypothetical protein